MGLRRCLPAIWRSISPPLGPRYLLQNRGSSKFLPFIDTRRYSELPDIPAIAEQLPSYEKQPSGVRLYGPASLPMAIARRIHGEVVSSLNSPELQKRLRETFFSENPLPPEEFAAQTRREVQFMTRALEIAKLRPE